jgi:hypothetical protein
VIDQELILFVSLNINKNTAPVRALGKMLLQNLQLVVGKRYETQTERKRRKKPLFSVVMDEFAPFGYRNFAQILNTARGTNTAFLFSLQSLPQLLKSGKGFQQDVSSAPGTTMLLQTRDEETAKYFKQASSQVPVQKRTQQLWRKDFLGFENFQKAIERNGARATGIPRARSSHQESRQGKDGDPDDRSSAGHFARPSACSATGRCACSMSGSTAVAEASGFSHRPGRRPSSFQGPKACRHDCDSAAIGGQVKWIAAEQLTDVLNAKHYADKHAMEAITAHNRHMEACNRVIEQETLRYCRR